MLNTLRVFLLLDAIKLETHACFHRFSIMFWETHACFQCFCRFGLETHVCFLVLGVLR